MHLNITLYNEPAQIFLPPVPLPPLVSHNPLVDSALQRPFSLRRSLEPKTLSSPPKFTVKMKNLKKFAKFQRVAPSNLPSQPSIAIVVFAEFATEGSPLGQYLADDWRLLAVD